MKISPLLTSLAFLVAASCALPDMGPTPLTNAATVQTWTKQTNDPYTKTVSFTGPTQSLPPAAQDDWHAGQWHLEASMHDGVLNDVVELSIYYYRSENWGWAMLDRAYDIESNPLSVGVIVRRVEQGSPDVDGVNVPDLAEFVTVALPRAYLESHRASGINLKVMGNGGAAIVVVPAAYIDGFLAALSAPRK